MAIAASNVAVGETEVSLASAAGVTHVKPLYNDVIYVGPTGVTKDSGFPVQGSESFTLGTGEELFGISEKGTINVRVLTEGA